MGVCFFGAFIEIILSQILPYLKKIITPVVTGIVITTIGIYLIRAGVTDFIGGNGAKDAGSYSNLFLGFLVLAVVLTFTLVKNNTFRISSVFIGMLVGYIVAIFMGKVDFSSIGTQPIFAIPIPFKYGFSFDWIAFYSSCIYLFNYSY